MVIVVLGSNILIDYLNTRSDVLGGIPPLLATATYRSIGSSTSLYLESPAAVSC